LPRLPPQGQAWLKGLNPFWWRAVEHDLRRAGPDLFVKYWESLRDTLQKLERDFGPSDNWSSVEAGGGLRRPLSSRRFPARWSIIQHAATIFFAYFVGFQHNNSISQDFRSKLSTRAALKIRRLRKWLRCFVATHSIPHKMAANESVCLRRAGRT
jgi:hypothetical protein